MSPPIYNGGDILVYRELSVCLSVRPSVRPSVCLSHFSFPLSNSNSFDPILTKFMKMFVGTNGGQVNNQLNPTKHFGVTALEGIKNMGFALISGPSIYGIYSAFWNQHEL